MNPGRWYASPLAATAAVLGGLSILAIPLHRLTSSRQEHPAAPPATTPTAAETLPCVLRIKLLDPLAHLALASPSGQIVWQAGPLPAGESEHDLSLALDHGTCELNASATAGPEETAIFLTLMPDGHEERTAYLTGAGPIEGTLRFVWPPNH